MKGMHHTSPLGISNPSQETHFCTLCFSIRDTHLSLMEGMLGDKDQVMYEVAEWAFCSLYHLGCRICGSSPCFNRKQFPNLQRGPPRPLQADVTIGIPSVISSIAEPRRRSCGARRTDRNCRCKLWGFNNLCVLKPPGGLAGLLSFPLDLTASAYILLSCEHQWP